jgi:4-hydroxy-tetrahydrodipicolinate reductase
MECAMPPIRVVVSGTGRMGKEVLLGICRDPDVEPVGVLEKFSQEEYLSLPDGSGLVPLGNDPEALLTRTRPQVVIDFTNAEWTARVARAALAVGARPVIGTTGLPDAFVQELERECRERRLGGVIAANFAIGAVLLMHLAAIASRYFDNAEIIELHHDQKVDAPSGTALSTVRGMLAARENRPFTYPATERETLRGTRGGESGGIAVHSVRLPGLVAHQEVIFGGLGQTLTLRHDATSRESFIPGVLIAAKEVVHQEELVRGLDRLMGLT